MQIIFKLMGAIAALVPAKCPECGTRRAGERIPNGKHVACVLAAAEQVQIKLTRNVFDDRVIPDLVVALNHLRHLAPPNVYAGWLLTLGGIRDQARIEQFIAGVFAEIASRFERDGFVCEALDAARTDAARALRIFYPEGARPSHPAPESVRSTPVVLH